ncbi:hypothetical protein [Malacoplasma iowae]|uniref:hypothetical protein n=1 Tax=Malacoplasma iowae TaxID=2116 RepID=UPI003872BE62|nr:hypothetical protein QX180_05555 [Malacoplasma iowae]
MLNVDKIIDIHINNLNNLQNTIKRLSNIGYTLIAISTSIISIFVPLIFSLNLIKNSKIIMSYTLFLIIVCLFFSNLVNLRNERMFVFIYNQKSKIDIFYHLTFNLLKKPTNLVS